MNFLEVTYRLAPQIDDAEALAASLLLEQTVEVPAPVAARDAHVREHMTGHVLRQRRAPDGALHVRLALPAVTAASNAAQFLNVLFGNASLHAGVSLAGFALPEALRALFPGPRFGIAGLRERTGAAGRPLTATALKPAGLALENLAALCRTFARGGIDLIKDDHYLADQPRHPFAARVAACQRAVDETNAQTGGRAVYAPHLSGLPEHVRRQAETAQEAGARAVLAAPMLMGLPAFAELVRCHVDVPVLAHPSFAGHGWIKPPVLLGRLFRLFGADASIFAGHGGRFGTAATTCRALARALREDWHALRPALPMPAGGMTVERAPELVRFYGADVGLLIGGSLLEAGDALLERTCQFTEAVRRAASGADR